VGHIPLWKDKDSGLARMGVTSRSWPGLTEPACRFSIDQKVGDRGRGGKRRGRGGPWWAYRRAAV